MRRASLSKRRMCFIILGAVLLVLAVVWLIPAMNFYLNVPPEVFRNVYDQEKFIEKQQAPEGSGVLPDGGTRVFPAIYIYEAPLTPLNTTIIMVQSDSEKPDEQQDQVPDEGKKKRPCPEGQECPEGGQQNRDSDESDEYHGPVMMA